MNTARTIVMMLMMMLVMVSVATAFPLAFAQTETDTADGGIDVNKIFSENVNEVTLSIVVGAGIIGAVIANLELYNKNAKPDEHWQLSKFIPTLVTSLLVGTATGVSLTMFLGVAVGASIVKGVVLFIIVTYLVRNIEKGRHTNAG